MKGNYPSPDRLKLTGDSGRIIGSDQPMPPAPDWLDDDGKIEWDKVVPLLAERRLVSPMDVALLAGYCDAVSRHRKAVLQLRQEGDILTGARGKQSLNPLARYVNSLLVQMTKFAQDFGLSPSGRSRLEVPAPKNPLDDELNAFLDDKPWPPPGR